MESLSASTVLSALLPVMIVIAVAFLIKRVNLVTSEHVAGIERVTYVVFFPTLLFASLSTARFDQVDIAPFVIALVGVQILFSVISWFAFTRSPLDGPAATSAFQGAIRFNTYIAFAILFAVFGQEAIQIASMPLALVIITVNLFCVAILIRYGKRETGKPTPAMWKSIATNPLILASVAGLLVNPLQIDWPAPVETAFDWFSTAAIALGLFAVGAALTPVSGKGSIAAIAASNGMNLIVKPAMFMAVAIAMRLPLELMAIGLICTAVPTATSAYILARQLGGDAPLMAQIVTMSTVASAVTVTAWLLSWPFFAAL